MDQKNVPEFVEKLNQKYQKSQSLQNTFKDNDKNFKTQLQIAKYTKMDIFKNPPAIYCGYNDTVKANVFFVFGSLIPDHKKEIDIFNLYFIKTIEEFQEKPYYLIFFNTNLMTQAKLSDFKELFATLPYNFYINLRGFIIMHANFIVKSGSFFSSSELMKILKKQTEYIDTIRDLANKPLFWFELLEKLPDYVKASDSSYKDVVKRQESIMLKQKRKSANLAYDDDDDEDENYNKASKILGQAFSRYQYNQYGIPFILEVLILYFTQNNQYLLYEGIFRKQAAAYEERLLEAAIANRRFRYIQRIEDPHIVAGIIKQFFIQLPDPLFTFEGYQKIIQETQGKKQDDSIGYLKKVIERLPEINQKILPFIVDFFRKVIIYEDSNKMSAYNMAVVFAPSFFRPEKQSMCDLIYAGFAQIFMLIIIQFFCQSIGMLNSQFQ